MKKIISFITLLLILSTSLYPRKKVALVLSGGGAKGTAHVGALKVIEKAGIPIDYIVGTSMGAIVGSLYSIGYTPETLDSIFMAQDWSHLLSDQIQREKMSLQAREQSDKYILSLPFAEKPQDALLGGVIQGRNIGRMLWDLTEGYHDSIDFRRMPIPFACVSQDLVTGKEIVHRSGVLPIAVRASMSLPGIFAPVNLGKYILVDGGFINNYPVDVAREMGADIVIGVDVQEELKTAKEMENDIIAQITQLIDLQSKDKWQRNIKNSDVYIHVNMKGYSSASFKTEAIDTLIERGYHAAEAQWENLIAVKKKIGTVGKLPQEGRQNIPVPINYWGQEQEKYRHLLIGDAPKNSLNLGARYDNEEMAALIFNTQFQFQAFPKNTFGLTIRLGNKMFGRLDYAFHLGKEWHLASAYDLEFNDFNIYSQGKRVCEINFRKHKFVVLFKRSWREMLINLGGGITNYNYGDFLYKFENEQTETDIDKETYLKFGGSCSFNNLDHPIFATQGQSFLAQYQYLIPLNQGRPFHVASFYWRGIFSPTKRFAIQPWFTGRYTTSDNTVSEANTLGGQEAGKYFEQQVPFFGINRFEVAHQILFLAGTEFRQRILKNHYISIVGNVGITAQDDWLHLFKNSFGDNPHYGYYYAGGALKYDWKTIIGPIGLTLHYSNRTKSLGGYIRAGFDF